MMVCAVTILVEGVRRSIRAVRKWEYGSEYAIGQASLEADEGTVTPPFRCC